MPRCSLDSLIGGSKPGLVSGSSACFLLSSVISKLPFHRAGARRRTRSSVALPAAQLNDLPGAAGLFGMAALCKLFDDLRAEGRQVAGLTAGDQSLVGYHFLVDPRATSIFGITADRGEGCDGPAFEDIGFG